MTVERRLIEALTEFDRVEPSPDLFERVQQSLEADRQRRTSAIRWSAGSVLVLLVAVAVVGIPAGRTDVNSLVTAGWAVSVAEVLLMGIVVVALGPAIGRFGSIYLAGVFRLAPETGVRFQRLLDTAYYLVFSGYVLTVTSIRRVSEDVLLSVSMRGVLDRVAGLLLLMGVLHAVTLVALPLVGLLFSSIVRRDRRRRAGHDVPLPSSGAEQAELVARAIVWSGVAAIAITALLGVGVLVGIGVGG